MWEAGGHRLGLESLPLTWTPQRHWKAIKAQSLKRVQEASGLARDRHKRRFGHQARYGHNTLAGHVRDGGVLALLNMKFKEYLTRCVEGDAKAPFT